MSIAQLNDARALKRANLPLNLPLEHREFSRVYSEHWFDLTGAHAEFMAAVGEYCDGARAGSLGKWRLLKRHMLLPPIFFE
jgi:hypothetical protein